MIISIKEVRNFIISILIPLIVGYLSNVLSRLLSGISTSTYYSQLIKPSFAPPSFIFPIVWTILYVLMGISAYKILKKGCNVLLLVTTCFKLCMEHTIFWTRIKIYGFSYYSIANNSCFDYDV